MTNQSQFGSIVFFAVHAPYHISFSGIIVTQNGLSHTFYKSQNSKMQHAMDKYRQEQLKEKHSGLRKIAAKFAVSFTTLGRLVKGGISMSTFNVSKQKIKAEEVVFVDFILESADWGLPPTHHSIELYVNAILKSHVGDGYEQVRIKWVFGFLDHHHDQLQSHWSKPLDTQRA